MKRIQLPSTTKRVVQNTSHKCNRRIFIHTIGNISKFSNAGSGVITERIRELDREWDTERVLEVNAALFILTTTLLGALKNKKWLIVSSAAALFLLQHALQGWCPPLPLLRMLGVRTADEISEEKFCLRLLRGDYDTEPCVSREV